MIVDTSVLFAYFDRDDPDHARCTEVIEGAAEDLVVSPYVIAELDYLVDTRRGVPAETSALAELAGGAWQLAIIDAATLTAAIRVLSRYVDQNIGLAHASIVVLADRYRTRTIATLDRRHFTVLRPLSGGRFTVLP